MALVQGSQLGLVEPLDDGEDRRIDEPNVGIGVLITDFADASIILGLEVLDAIGAGDDIVEKDEEDSGVKPGAYKPVYLRKDRRRDHERLDRVLQETKTPPMIGIGSVERRVQRSGVED